MNHFEGKRKSNLFNNLLFIVCEYDQDQIGKILIPKGADINAKDIIYQNTISSF